MVIIIFCNKLIIWHSMSRKFYCFGTVFCLGFYHYFSALLLASTCILLAWLGKKQSKKKRSFAKTFICNPVDCMQIIVASDLHIIG